MSSIAPTLESRGIWTSFPELARSADCTVRSIYGRRRHLPELKGKGALRAAAEREAVEMPMQGSASGYRQTGHDQGSYGTAP
jgi:hypothetical protein